MKLRSSDQRYRHVQRTKRDTQAWEVASRDLDFALRAVRTGEGDFSAVEEAIRAGAAEFSHILLACGRTATDFRRNYRRGSPNWHIVNTNAICPVETLQRERLDGYVLMRLSREQTKNVKLRWAKLREQDRLIHDPQGALWAEVMGCHIDGERDEHLDMLLALRERGRGLVDDNQAISEEHREARADKELDRFFRLYAQGFDAVASDGKTTPPEVIRETASWRYGIAHRIYSTGSYLTKVTPAEARLELEKSLVVAEAFLASGQIDQAIWDPDTSQRHCSAARLRERMRAVEEGFAAIGYADELAEQIAFRAADQPRRSRYDSENATG